MAGSMAMATPFAMKNKIINGAMEIDQRNAGASVTATTANLFSADRWCAVASQSSKYTIQQNSANAPAGFINYLNVTSLSAYSVLAGDYFAVQQIIEGVNIYDLAWGTANAKSVTLSFKVYSSLTGLFGGTLTNNGSTRSYPFTYTISSANTWTAISITIPGDTTGTWLTTNGVGVKVAFGLGVGSTYSGPANTWAGANYVSATGATSVVGTNGATFYITGVQFEVGTQATPFEWRPYGTELQLAQRYYAKMINTSIYGDFGNSNNYSVVNVFTPVPMRATPTFTVSSVGGTFGAQLNLTNYNWCGYYIVSGPGNAASVFEPAFSSEL